MVALDFLSLYLFFSILTSLLCIGLGILCIEAELVCFVYFSLFLLCSTELCFCFDSSGFVHMFLGL